MARGQRSASVKTEEWKLLAQHGLTPFKTLGDGNCLFRALSDQLYGTHDRHLEVRREVVDYMRSHPDDFLHFIALDLRRSSRRSVKRKNTGSVSPDACAAAEMESAFQAHLASMEKNFEWGGDLEIAAFSAAYNKDVIVWGTERVLQHHTVSVVREQVHIAFHGPSHQHYSTVRKATGPASGVTGISRIDPEKPKDNTKSQAKEVGASSPPCLLSNTGNYSIERDFDSEDEEIRGPNKRINLRMRQAREQAKKAKAAGKNTAVDLPKTASQASPINKPEAEKNPAAKANGTVKVPVSKAVPVAGKPTKLPLQPKTGAGQNKPPLKSSKALAFSIFGIRA